jgi:Na+/melibiose symporter-like transporter
VLASGGYRSSTDGDVAQPDSALTAITLGFSVLPAVLVVVSLVWLARYTLGSDEVDADPEPSVVA